MRLKNCGNYRRVLCIQSAQARLIDWSLRDYQVEGQYGLEETPEAHVAKMVEVFREVRRVLRPDGTLWLNYGDSYAGSGGAGGDYAEGGLKEGQPKYNGTAHRIKDMNAKQATHMASDIDLRIGKTSGLKPKDLCGIPWRVALALQADGWWLRQDIIWHKPNPMPESVTDRCTKSHEYLFLFAKSGAALFWTNKKKGKAVSVQPAGVNGIENEDWEWIEHSACKGKGCNNKRCVNGKVKTTLWEGHDYYFDAEAIREEASYDGRRNEMMKGANKYQDGYMPKQSLQTIHTEGHQRWNKDDDGNRVRNKRSVWTIPTEACKAAHFAVFPKKLVEPCIRAGTSEKGCCPKCGKPWVRIIDSEQIQLQKTNNAGKQEKVTNWERDKWPRTRKISETLAWQPSCECGGEPVPCTVLDCFSGSGTVGLVALPLGRNYIGIEISPIYCQMSRKRIHNECGLIAKQIS